jgi:hypothetical protein
MKNAVFWDVTLCGSHKNQRFGGTCSMRQLLVTADVPRSPILVTLMTEALHSSETSVLARATGVTSQEMAFLKMTIVKTSNFRQ